PRNLLREIGFFIAGLAGTDKTDGIRPVARTISHCSFQCFDNVDQRTCHGFRHGSERSGIGLHAFFEQGIAWAYGHTMAAAHTAGTIDRMATVPQHPGKLLAEVDAERLIHLHILTGLHAASAQDALVRVVAVERVTFVFIVGAAPILVALYRNVHVR